jgi:hypothetical protein
LIIRKYDNLYIIKIVKETINNFDYFNQEEISKLFHNIIMNLKKRYQINGLLDINVYTNEEYGMIIEIEEVESYYDEIDMHIHFHLDTLFLQEINEIKDSLQDVYFYKDKYYTRYNQLLDSNIIYKTEEILTKGIKIA